MSEGKCGHSAFPLYAHRISWAFLDSCARWRAFSVHEAPESDPRGAKNKKKSRSKAGPGIWHVSAEVVALAPEALAPGSKASAQMALAPGLRRLKLQFQEALALGARALVREAGAHVLVSAVEVPSDRARGTLAPACV